MTVETALLAGGGFCDRTLSVGDNGGRMPADPDIAKTALGTSIAQAIPRRLYAKVRLADANPVTTVSVDHTGVASNAQAPTEVA